jgi:hypothetical protein
MALSSRAVARCTRTAWPCDVRSKSVPPSPLPTKLDTAVLVIAFLLVGLHLCSGSSLAFNAHASCFDLGNLGCRVAGLRKSVKAGTDAGRCFLAQGEPRRRRLPSGRHASQTKGTGLEKQSSRTRGRARALQRGRADRRCGRAGPGKDEGHHPLQRRRLPGEGQEQAGQVREEPQGQGVQEERWPKALHRHLRRPGPVEHRDLGADPRNLLRPHGQGPPLQGRDERVDPHLGETRDSLARGHRLSGGALVAFSCGIGWAESRLRRRSGDQSVAARSRTGRAPSWLVEHRGDRWCEMNSLRASSRSSRGSLHWHRDDAPPATVEPEERRDGRRPAQARRRSAIGDRRWRGLPQTSLPAACRVAGLNRREHQPERVAWRQGKPA